MTMSIKPGHSIWVAAVTLSAYLLGCGSGDAVSPDSIGLHSPDAAASVASPSNRCLWGLWDIAIQKSVGKVEVLPVRGADFHLNALAFLEPPALSGLTFDSGTLVINQSQNYVGVDVILNHPFPGMNQYSGFDVRGIVLTPGSDLPFGDISLIFPSYSEPRLLNPDGWTRWWNPKEFPGTGIFGFKQGLIGSTGGAGVFTSTVNGYKYFADGLGLNDPVSTVPNGGRGAFLAGSSNRRHYEISFGDDPADWLRFQYAVDACWAPPSTMDNPTVPDDFPMAANAPEGYAIQVIEKENTLYWLEGLGTGGKLDLDINVYTWRPDAVKRVVLDAPGIIGSPLAATVVNGSGGGPDDPVYSTYAIEVVPDALQSDGVKECLITVETEEKYTQGGYSMFFGPSGAVVSAYHRFQTLVSWVPPLKWDLVTAKILPTQPETVLKEMSVVGGGSMEGVYFFADDYMLYKYDLDYQSAVHATTLGGFFGYTELDLYGAPETLGRFELCPFGQFVASTISATKSPTFLGGLKRDYAFFFNEVHSPGGQLPMQIGMPDPALGYFRFVDTAANWADDVKDAKIYWVQVNDPDAGVEPDPEITVILGVYQYAFTGNPFSSDVDYISGSLVPAGTGDGKVDVEHLDRFALDGDPQGVSGSMDLVCWFMETDPPALESFGVVSSDSSGLLNVPLTTINSFYGTPRDIAVMPTSKGGYGAYNWVVVLEQGAGTWSIETFDQTGAYWPSMHDIIGFPACIDVDPEHYRIHVWFSTQPGGPIYTAVFGLSIG